MSKTIIVEDKTFKYQIWDTAGQEKVGWELAGCVVRSTITHPPPPSPSAVPWLGANVLSRGRSSNHSL